MSDGRINVFNEDGQVIARVTYNENLDYRGGRNWSNGGTGYHKGLTRLKSGQYVLIHGTDYQGERCWGEIITKNQAVQEILKSNDLELLEKFKDLKEIADEILNSEEEW